MTSKQNSLKVEKLVVKGIVCVDGNVTINGKLIIDGVEVDCNYFLPKVSSGLLSIYPGGFPYWEGTGNLAASWTDTTTGQPIGTQLPRLISETSSSKVQFNRDKIPGKIVQVFQAENSDYYLNVVQVSNQKLSYEHTTLPNTNGRFVGVVYDPIADKYLVNDKDARGLWHIDPTTFNATDLTAINGGGYGPGGFTAIDLFTLNNNVYKIGTNSIKSNGPIFQVFNKSTGQYIKTVYWLGSFIFPGVESIDLQVNGNIGCLSCTVDETNSQLWLLIGSNVRVLVSVKADSLVDLDSILMTGNFDLTMVTNYSRQFLNSIVYIPPTI